MVNSKCCGPKSSVRRWITTAVAALGIAVPLATSADGAEEQGWQLVVPSTTALPSIEPPSSFNRSVNNILPMGTSEELSEALPNRLQTNKFYSNFLVSQPTYSGALNPAPCICLDHSVARAIDVLRFAQDMS